MKLKTIALSVVLATSSSLLAQGVAENAAELKSAALSQETQQELITEADGCSIQIAPDGSYQIFSRGTGTYDFNDPDDIQDATKEATMRAKANISNFFKESVSQNKALDILTKKAKSLTKDGQIKKEAVSKETVKTAAESMRNNSEAILSGVITLAVIKQPGNGEGGEIQVTVGVSSLTIMAAQETAGGINRSLENRSGNGGATNYGNSVAPTPNKGYIRRTNSAF